MIRNLSSRYQRPKLEVIEELAETAIIKFTSNQKLSDSITNNAKLRKDEIGVSILKGES